MKIDRSIDRQIDTLGSQVSVNVCNMYPQRPHDGQHQILFPRAHLSGLKPGMETDSVRQKDQTLVI